MRLKQEHSLQSLQGVSVSALRGEYLSLQLERDALRAEVERLRGVIEYLCDRICDEEQGDDYEAIAVNAVEQCQNAIAALRGQS